MAGCVSPISLELNGKDEEVKAGKIKKLAPLIVTYD